MFKFIGLHRPEHVAGDVFYLCPLQNPKGNVWFKNQPIGVHTLTATVKRLCEKAGIVGYKTNHSLRVTTATRLFQNGTDEQLFMERTGHRSTDGVRAYKCSWAISKVLNREKAAEKPAVCLRCSLLPPSAFCSSTLDS